MAGSLFLAVGQMAAPLHLVVPIHDALSVNLAMLRSNAVTRQYAQSLGGADPREPVIFHAPNPRQRVSQWQSDPLDSM